MYVFTLVGLFGLISLVISYIFDYLVKLLIQDNQGVWLKYDKPTTYSLVFSFSFVLSRAFELEELSERVSNCCKKLYWFEVVRIVMALLSFFIFLTRN